MPRDLDVSKVPEILRPAIPYAQKWRYEDTHTEEDGFWYGKEKWLAMVDANQFGAMHDVLTLERALSSMGPRDRVPPEILEEYDAFNTFFIRLEEIGQNVCVCEKYRLLGYKDESDSRPEVLIKRFLLHDAQQSMTDNLIELKLSAWMKNDERRPFVLRLLDIRSAEIECKNEFSFEPGNWLTYAFTLRLPREFVFSETRHCYIETGRFLLKAVYGEVEIEKDW